jgi:hypothetical protein
MENQSENNKKTWADPELTILTITNGKDTQSSENTPGSPGS